MKYTDEELSKVFHAYDIRGLVDEGLSPEFFENLGKAFVTFLKAKKIAVGFDIRPESKEFATAFIKGATETGCDVVYLDMIATEMLYYAVGSDLSFDGGAIITASHNPAGWNGVKMVGKGASALSKEWGLTEIKQMIIDNDYLKSDSVGKVISKDIYPEFKAKILEFLKDVEVKKLKVVVDAGNGIGGKIFDYVFGDLGLDTTRMYFEPDGNFPNHVPNPLEEENVQEIRKKTVELSADIGIAIDGDADRVFFIDNQGRNPSGIYTGSIFTKYFLSIEPGAKIVHDPRITWPIEKEVTKLNGISLINKAGHSYFKQRMKNENAIYGTELSSHFFYRDFYFADSGMVTIAVMLKLLSQGLDLVKELDYLYETYPSSGEINYKVDNVQDVIEKVQEFFNQGKIENIDGVSIEFDDWRFNLRGSNTQPLIRLNLEGKSKEVIIEKFKLLEEVIDGERDNLPALPELRGTDMISE